MTTNERVPCPGDGSVPLVDGSTPPGGRWRIHDEDSEVGVTGVGSDDSLGATLIMDGPRSGLEWLKAAAKVGLTLMSAEARLPRCRVPYRLHVQIWPMLAIGSESGAGNRDAWGAQW